MDAAFLELREAVGLAALAVALGAYLLRARRHPVLVRPALAGAALAVALELPAIIEHAFGAPLAIARAAAAVRWLLFGAFASAALFRHGGLGMGVAARRRASRALLAIVFLMAGGLLLLGLDAWRGARELGLVEIAALLGLLLLSQGFRDLLDRVAGRVYGVPVPASASATHEAYRRAVAEAAARGMTPQDEEALARLREDLGVDEPTARLLERLADESLALPLGAGQRIAGRYLVLQMLGRGGAGRAWLAEDAVLGRRVVLKEVPLEGTGPAERSLEEARLLGTFQHPHIVTLHDALRRPGRAILVTEHVEGGSLADLLAREGPLRGPEAEALLAGVVAGVAAIHERGLIHLDVKPENVLLARDGRPKVADFGLARFSGSATVESKEGRVFAGTPEAMAPEQRAGGPLSPATDVYALGLLARRALAAPLPPHVEAAVSRALRPRPEDRWPSAVEMLAALRHAQ